MMVVSPVLLCVNGPLPYPEFHWSDMREFSVPHVMEESRKRPRQVALCPKRIHKVDSTLPTAI